MQTLKLAPRGLGRRSLGHSGIYQERKLHDSKDMNRFRPLKVFTDPKELYFGLTVNVQSLTPGLHPRLGPILLKDWLSHKAEPGA
jgi:hypothetical protein